MKIETLFERDPSTHEHYVIDRVRAGMEWVPEGYGTIAEKIDGENCRVLQGKLFKRQKIHDQQEYSMLSYAPVNPNNALDAPLCRAYAALQVKNDGIYEAVGPGIKGNPYKLTMCQMVPILPARVDIIINEREHQFKRTFDGIKEFLAKYRLEGLIFRHQNGKLAKIKRQDYGIPWPPDGSSQARQYVPQPHQQPRMIEITDGGIPI